MKQTIFKMLEERNRGADLADAMLQDFRRQIVAKLS